MPSSLKKAYKKKGINSLFEWQATCLSNERLFEPTFQNLIYTAPTSAGKTLVAEVIAACNVLKTGRRALFVFPYISNAREKLYDLQPLWRSVHLVVKAFIGASSASLHGWSAAVCTIEKANTLINAFIENNMLSEIGTIVVDELHMLFDSERGAIIENMLSKILYASEHKNINIQIIGMSATMEEHERLAQWLRADFYVSNFRPLNLREFVVIDGTVFDLLARRKDRVIADEFRINSDVKNLIGMTVEAILEEKAILIFCPTKMETEKYAVMLARYARYCASKGASNRFYKLCDILAPPTQRQIVEYFVQKTSCTDGDLLGIIAMGIAFHHAGLTVEEREEIEFLFRSGSLKVLVSTSTLSSGVNLPAHRVLIMTSANSHIPFTSITYRQMVGRAGRQGQRVVEGESYVLCSKTDWPTIQSQIEKNQSSFPVRPVTRIILEAVSSEFVSTYEELRKLLSFQFSTLQAELDVELARLDDLKLVAISVTKDGLSTQDIKALSVDGQDSAIRIAPTQLGRAVLASSLPPGVAIQIFFDLEKALRSVCLDSELHMLFLVTPINNLAINTNAIDWNFYHQKWVELPEPLARVARHVGISERFFMQKLAGKTIARNDETLNLHIRFFAALVLYELINENPLEKVSRKFRINRGLLQSLQQQAATYAYMVVAFCDRLGWFYLKALLEGFAERMQFGVRRDLTELVRVPGIDAIRARHFHQNGIKSLLVLANASVDDICRILRTAVPFPVNPNADPNKNTWLFGEPPIEDVYAARMLIERALEVLKEKLEFAAYPSTLFSNGKRLMDLTSTSLANSTSHWLSDDNDLTASELLHESAMKVLCETLSPLQIDSSQRANVGIERNAELGRRSPSLNNDAVNSESALTIEEQEEILRSVTDEFNNNLNVEGIGKATTSDGSFTIDELSGNNENIDPSAKMSVHSVKKTNAANLNLKRTRGRSKSKGSDNEQRKGRGGGTPASLIAIQKRPRGRPPKVLGEQDAKSAEKLSEEGLSVKIHLKSLDCAQILVDGRPVKITPKRVTQKKTWTQRVSKGLTPLQSLSGDKIIDATNSPLNKHRSPLNEVGTVGKTTNKTNGATDEKNGNENASRNESSVERLVVIDDEVSNVCSVRNSIENNNACTGAQTRGKNSLDDSLDIMPSKKPQNSLDDSLDVFLLESAGSEPAIAQMGGVTNTSNMSSFSITDEGIFAAATTSTPVPLVELPCAQKQNNPKTNETNESGEATCEQSIDDVNASDAENEKNENIKALERQNKDGHNDLESFESEDVQSNYNLSSNLNESQMSAKRHYANLLEICNNTILDSSNTPTSSSSHNNNSSLIESRKTEQQRDKNIAEDSDESELSSAVVEKQRTPKKILSDLVVLKSTKSPAATNKNEDEIQLLCRCNWPPSGLFADLITTVEAKRDTLSLCSSAPQSSTFSCGMCVSNNGDEVLIFVPTTRRCFLLPLKRTLGFCTKCKLSDVEDLLRNILMNKSVTKWLPDALEFLRVVRRVFVAHDKRIAQEIARSNGLNGSGKSPTSLGIRENQTAQCAPTCRPRNFGCVRTLDALAVDNVEDTEEIAGFDNKPWTTIELDAEKRGVKAMANTKNAIRKIAKGLNLTKWQPRWSASSRSKFAPSFSLRVISAAIDAQLTHAIAYTLLQHADARHRDLQLLYMRSTQAVAVAELAGMAFYWRRTTKMLAATVTQMATVERRVFKLCGGIKFNLDASDEVANVLFVKMNLAAPQNATATRRHLSTNGAVLRQIDHPATRAIMHWRKLQHAHSALRALLQEAAIQANMDSRLRTCFDNFSAAAGRISSSHPNLHFLPKEELIADKYSARSVFVAPPGMILMAADYCQLELRVLCELSQDRALAHLLSPSRTLSTTSNLRNNDCESLNDDEHNQSEEDPFERIARQFRSFHAQSASRLRSDLAMSVSEISNEEDFASNTSSKKLVRAQCSEFSRSDARRNGSVENEFVCDRQKAKQLCYAIIYGMGADTLAREMRVSKGEAQTLINCFFDLFPKVKCWMEKRIDQCRQRAYCETFMGRRRAFCSLAAVGERIGEERRQARQAINYIVQGTASEMFRQALINVDRMFEEEFPAHEPIVAPRIIMQLHDELIVEVAEVHTEKCARVLRRAMENVFADRGFQLPFPVKLSRGKSWGSLTPF